jgi:hypothetical protein
MLPAEMATISGTLYYRAPFRRFAISALFVE